MLEAGGGRVQQIACDQRAPPCYEFQTLTFYQPDLGVDDRFGCKAVNGSVLQTEDIAHQMKGANLTATVEEKLVASHCPKRHLIDIIGRLILSEDLFVFFIAKITKIDPRWGHSSFRGNSVSTKASKHGVSPCLYELLLRSFELKK